MIAAAVILVFSGMHLMKKAYNQQQVPVAENTQAVDPVQKPQEIQTGREQDLQKDVSNGRIQLWKSGIEIWKTSPVYGTGYSTVVDYAKENVKGTYIIENSQGDYHNLHNQLINVLVYQGSIGAILLVGMFLYFCRYIWKAFQKSLSAHSPLVPGAGKSPGRDRRPANRTAHPYLPDEAALLPHFLYGALTAPDDL